MPTRPPLHRHAGHNPEARRKQVEQQRQSSSARGYGSRWQKARAGFLATHPLCAQCQRQGQVTAATVVDHIVPHRLSFAQNADQQARAHALFWDSSNWQSLCKPCHDAKTAQEVGFCGY